VKRIYATADGNRTATLEGPDGWVMPPKITLHRPLIGPVEFYDAECYGIKVHRAAVRTEPEQ
jgi:hypothetical protein